MKIIQWVISFWCCFVSAILGFAQNSERFYNFSRRDGLASGSITSITQDRQGLVWIGTKQGLNRYDGAEFIHFHAGNSALTSNDVSSLFVDDFNQLWIGTFGKGVLRMGGLSLPEWHRVHPRVNPEAPLVRFSHRHT